MTKILIPVFLFLTFTTKAQFAYTLHQDIPVEDLDGTQLDLAWAGGLNSTQYNTIDLNGDGIADLALYDRMASRVLTFVTENNVYRYAPEFENYFPDISHWMLIRDYNCDGKKDIFTGDPLGIRVFLNTQTTSTPSWKQLHFFTGFSGSKSSVLLSTGFSGKINIQLQSDDLPSITDADGDGDLDIFNIRFAGSTIEFHKNLSIEKYGTCDSLEFERITQEWGKVKDCHCGTFAFNGEDCPTFGRVKHSGGKSLLLLDANNDQRLDMIFSEAECASIFELRNEGTVLNPVINNSSLFPHQKPAQIVSYPAVYHEDVDFDQKKDLIFSSNLFYKDDLESNLAESNLLYRNSGSAASPIYVHAKNNFLQDQMIDIGDNAVPAFTDFDGDGDYDMFVSTNSSDDFRSRIYLYENKGTEKSPRFKLVNTDYLFFSESNFYNLKIQFTDVNADNALDLVFTASSLEQGGTRLYIVYNSGKNLLDFNAQPVMETDFRINYYENVYVTDLDADGRVDLLVGRSSGKLEAWKNSASDSQLQFVRADADYLKLGADGFNQYISAFISDLDGDGNNDLLYSDQQGQVAIISNFKSVADGSTSLRQIIRDKISNQYTSYNLGGKTWPVAVNLFSTTKPSIIVGNTLGGLHVLKSENDEPLPDVASVEIFPNPASIENVMNLKIDRPAFVEIISTLGQRMSDPVRLQAHQLYQHNLMGLSPGLYFMKFTYQNKNVVKRIVIY